MQRTVWFLIYQTEAKKGSPFYQSRTKKLLRIDTSYQEHKSEADDQRRREAIQSLTQRQEEQIRNKWKIGNQAAKTAKKMEDLERRPRVGALELAQQVLFSVLVASMKGLRDPFESLHPPMVRSTTRDIAIQIIPSSSDRWDRKGDPCAGGRVSYGWSTNLRIIWDNGVSMYKGILGAELGRIRLGSDYKIYKDH